MPESPPQAENASAPAVRTTATVIALLIGALIVQVEITVVGTAMPDISAELRDVTLYPWVFAGYLVTYTATVPAFGMLADTIGRRTCYSISLVLLAAGSAMCGLAGSMELLIAGRLLQGVGAGALFVTAQTILGDLFSVEKRARVQSAFGLVGAIGAAAGPALGGWFATHASWRWAFLVNLPVAAACAALFLFGFRETTRRAAQPPNWRGSLLLTATLCALFAGVGKEGVNPSLLALAAALAVPFFFFERRSPRPILPPDLFRNPAFSLAAVTVMFVGGVQVAYLAFVPLYLQGVAGLSPMASGYIIAVPVTLVVTLSTFFVGSLIQRHGYRPALRAGAAFVLMATLSTSAAAWHAADHPGALALVLVLLGQAFLGASMGVAVTAAIICVQNQVGPERRGTATASLHLLRGVGATLTPAILGALYLASLRGQHLGIEPERFLNQKILSELDPDALASARAGLGTALRSLLPPLIGVGALAVVASLFFPRVDATK